MKAIHSLRVRVDNDFNYKRVFSRRMWTNPIPETLCFIRYCYL